MAFPEGSSSPNVRLDTGTKIQGPGVPGPHDPAPHQRLDQEAAQTLRSIRDQALVLRDAHSVELNVQTSFHTHEVERHDRVVRACNSALHELDPEQEQAYEPTPAQQIRQQRIDHGPITG